MADRLTQLQDTVNQQAEHFCNAIGVIQQSVQNNKQEDYAQIFAQLISRCAADIDTLIESLPNEDISLEQQNQSLKLLEKENQEAAKRLEDVAKKGELLLDRIQLFIQEIAQAQLED